MIKNLLTKWTKQFRFFYSYLGYRIFLGLFISLIVGLLEGFGIAMILPLLKMMDTSEVSNPSSLDNLSFIAKFFQTIDIKMTLEVILISILLLFSFKGLLKFIEGYYNIVVKQYFVTCIRNESVNKFSDFNYQSYIVADAGRIQSTLSGEVAKVVSAYVSYFTAMQNVVLVFVYLILAFISNPQFAAFVVLGGFLTNFIFRIIYRKTKQI